MKVLEGKLVATKGKFAIVGSRFNEFIVSKLISGAEDTLVRHGVDTDDITLVWVPGAFEIPLAAQKLAQSGKYDAVICLGAVIRGSTSHYDLVCNEAAKGIAQVNLQTGVPVTFGVVTTENIEQAIERAGTKAGNKGADAAIAALELANLLPQLSNCAKKMLSDDSESIFIYPPQFYFPPADEKPPEKIPGGFLYSTEPSPPMSAVSSSIRSSGNGGNATGFMAMDISFIGLSSAAARLECSTPHLRVRPDGRTPYR